MVSGMRSAAVCLLWIKCCIVVSAAEDEDLKLGHVFTSPQYRNCCIKKEKEKKTKKTDCLHLWLFLRLCRHSIRLTVGLRSVWNNVLIM